MRGIDQNIKVTGIKELMRWLKLILLVLLCGLCALASARLIRAALADMAFKTATNLDGVLRARSLDPENPVYCRSMGDHWLTVFPPRTRLAADAYRTAATLRPYNAIYWVDWAQASMRQGQPAVARRALETAEFLDANNRVIQLAMGNIYVELNDRERALFHHARAIRLNPALAANLSALYAGLGLTPLEISSRLLAPNAKMLRDHLLNCLTLDATDPETARQLWEHLRSLSSLPDAAAYRAYFNYLISRQRYSAARLLWGEIAREFYGRPWDEAREPFWNGDLSMPRRFEGGLEWQVPKPLPEGCSRVEIAPLEATSSSLALVVTFDGRRNLQGVLARHAFFVRPGAAYRLRCQAQAMDITTENGPYLALTLQGKPPVTCKSPILTGNGTGELSLSFKVPPACEWAELTIRRDFSQRLNNQVGGEAWFADFVLEPMPGEKGRTP